MAYLMDASGHVCLPAVHASAYQAFFVQQLAPTVWWPYTCASPVPVWQLEAGQASGSPVWPPNQPDVLESADVASQSTSSLSDSLPLIKLPESQEDASVIIDKLENCGNDERTVILKQLSPATLELSLSGGGCWLVQKALEVAGGEDRNELIDRLRGHVVTLIESPHGNHVIQKCIEVLPPHSVQFVVDELAAYPGGWIVLARHRYGCRVVERLIEHCTEETTHPIMMAVVGNAYTLWCHPFGNYVVQHIFEYGSTEQCMQIVSAMVRTDDILSLAQHKVACHVLERAFEKCGSQVHQTLVDAILSRPSGLLTLGCNRYGSFVARRILAVCTPAQSQEALRQLRAGTAQLRASRFGKHLAQYVDAHSNE